MLPASGRESDGEAFGRECPVPQRRGRGVSQRGPAGRGTGEVALFYSRIRPPDGERIVSELRVLNGLPGVLTERPAAPAGLARCWASGIELDADGLIRRSYAVLATRKLTAVHFPESVALG